MIKKGYTRSSPGAETVCCQQATSYKNLKQNQVFGQLHQDPCEKKGLYCSNACWDSTYFTGFITYPSPSTCFDIQEVSGHYKNSIIIPGVRGPKYTLTNSSIILNIVPTDNQKLGRTTRNCNLVVSPWDNHIFFLISNRTMARHSPFTSTIS